MKVSEAIDKLTNKRNDALSYMSDIYKKGDAGYLANEIRVTTYNIAINTLQQIEEPQAEKVEVPDYIAELIRKYKAKKETLVCSIANLYRESDEYKWYVDNAEIYERAWVNGYTVKPKSYIVKNCCGEVFSGFYGSGYTVLPRFRKEERHYYGFTDKSKAEAVAILVEGSVEEV